MTTKLERVIGKVKANKELCKKIDSEYYAQSLDEKIKFFISDAKTYIDAINKNRMCCIIPHVSNSGMSRIINFHSFEKTNYRQYYSLFKSLGYSYNNNHNGFRVNGCGMDMVFHTNYCNIQDFYNIGLISKKQCSILAQKTPTVL